MKTIFKTLVLCIALISGINAGAQDRYGLLTITGTFFQTQNYGYLQTINNLNATGVNNNNATELSGLNYIHTFRGAVYITNGDQARVDKYTVSSNGTLSKSGSLVYPAGSTKDKLVAILFVSETEAYTYAYGGLILYRFNPTTMTALKQIDLSSLRNTAYTTTTLTSMIKRGDYLYIGVANFSGFTSVTGPNQAQLAVVDIKKDTLVKSLIDQRTITLGYGNSNVKAFIMDENQDLYFSSSPTYQNSGTTKPTGVLRIKNGETTFDTTYFFNLQALMGNHANLGLNYYKNGMGYSCCLHEEKISPVDPFSGATDAVYRYWSINLATKTGSEIASLPYTKAYVSSWMQPVPDGRIMLPVGTANGDTIWMLNPETNVATKQFGVTGQCFGVFPLSNGLTGITENQVIQSLLLAPNPAQTEVVLGTAENATIETVKVFDYSGREMIGLTGLVNNRLDISRLNTGIYIIRALDSEQNLLQGRLVVSE